MSMTKVERWLLQSLFLLTAIIAALQTTGQTGISSFLFYLTFPLTVLLWLQTVRRGVSANDILLIVTLLCAVCCVLADQILYGGSRSVGYWKKLIMFAMTLLYFQSTHRLQADAALKRFFTAVATGLILVFALQFLLRRSAMYEINGVTAKYLTFGFTNPNLATMFLAFMSMLLSCRAMETGKQWLLLAAALAAVFVVMTGARNAYVALAVFAALLVSRKKAPIKLRHPQFWAWMPLIFAIVYMLAFSLPQVQALLSGTDSSGKAPDSRVEIWQQAFRAIRNSPLIGAYWAISEGTGVSQMHNSHLDIAASYGLPVLILVCVLLRRWLQQSRGVYLFGFLGAVLLGCGEAAIFSGGLGIYIFTGIFLLLAKEDTDEGRVCQQLF